MGGEVAFAIRRNGEFSTRVLWKGAAGAIARSDFFAGKGDVWDMWNESAPAPFAPEDYGLVIVDFDGKWVGGVQNYCDFTKAYLNFQDNLDIENFRKLWAAGRIVGEAHPGCEQPVPIQDSDPDSYIKTKRGERDFRSCAFIVSPPQGWDVEEFSRGRGGWTKFVEAILNRGFEFSEDEIAAWRRYEEDHSLAGNPIGHGISQHQARKLDQTTPVAGRNRGGRRI